MHDSKGGAADAASARMAAPAIAALPAAILWLRQVSMQLNAFTRTEAGLRPAVVGKDIERAGRSRQTATYLRSAIR